MSKRQRNDIYAPAARRNRVMADTKAAPLDWQPPRDCRVCGGDGWLSTTPVGKDSTCPYCKGTGKEAQPSTTEKAE